MRTQEILAKSFQVVDCFDTVKNVQITSNGEVLVSTNQGIYIVKVDDDLTITKTGEKYLQFEWINASIEVDGRIFKFTQDRKEVTVIDRSEREELGFFSLELE